MLDPTKTTVKKWWASKFFPTQVELKSKDLRDVASEDDFQIDLSDGTALFLK
jgi:hypothetical protein